MSRFIGERITVETDGEIREPIAFTLRGEKHRIADVLLNWFDWGFPAGTAQRSWKTRRHRNYFRVRTTTGDVYELYLDRATPSGEAEWYLYQKLDADESDSTTERDAGRGEE